MSATCSHAETATALYRVDDDLLCLDCAAERYVELDKRIIHAEVFAENLRVERDRLVALVGYSPSGSSLLLDHMEVACAAPEANPRSTYSMTVVDPDGMTRRVRVQADSEEEARASEQILAYEHVVEVAPA